MVDLLNDIMPTELHQSTVSHSGQKELIDSDAADSDHLFDDIDLDFKSNLPKYVNDNEIHFVFTIREDFLSEFEYYSASIPSLKQNRYGLRPINEEQASQIILRPKPGLIDLSVAKLIIEHVTGRTDFILDGIPEIEVDAAVLSIFLNRLYAKKDKADNNISSDLVNAYSGNIIKDFYLESIASNSTNGELISESSIITLEDHLLTREGRRNNVSRNDLISLGVSNNELDLLIDKRKLLRQFSHGNDLRIEYIHDILCPIVKERKNQRELFIIQERERKEKEAENLRLLKEEEAKRKMAEEQAFKDRLRLETERENIRKRNNLEYNLNKIATSNNVLSHQGRQLIDNALDFGEYKSFSAIAGKNPADYIILFPKVSIMLVEEFFEDDSDFINQYLFKDPLLNDLTCELSFSQNQKESSTIDGIYSVRVSYCNGLISNIFFLWEESYKWGGNISRSIICQRWVLWNIHSS